MPNKNWKLGSYVIQEGADGQFCWGTYMDEGKYGLSRFIGHCWMELDTLVMSSWKVHEGAEGTWDEANQWVKSLPPWDKTTYCVKLADFGLSGLIDCKTLKEVPDKEATPIMLALGFTKVTPPKALQEAEEILENIEGNNIPAYSEGESPFPKFCSFKLQDLFESEDTDDKE